LLYILDTDHISLLQQKHPLIIAKINQIDSSNIFITIVSFQEQVKGWLNLINRNGNNASIIWAYQGLSDVIKYFNQITVLDFDENAYHIFQNLKSQSIRIGSQDLRIASIALAVNGVVVTRNQKDFSKIPDLIREDWTLNN
jgi:tRNA(fMet)-specific endonuclease VapC